MTLFDTIKGWIQTPTVPLATFPVRCAQAAASEEGLEADRHYVRLRLAQMFLKYDSTWFQHWFPAVQCLVRFQFGDGVAEIPNVADAKRVNLAPTTGTDLIVKNVPLTPTVPFHGGLIELSASLMAIKGENGIDRFIGVLAGFADVLQTPQISAALKIAQPLVGGLQVLLNSGNDHLHLGYFNSFKAGELRDGYILVLRAPAAGADPGRFLVVDKELRIRAPGSEAYVPFTACDYMLLHTEVFDERDDWEQLTFISQPWDEVVQAISTQGPEWEKLASTRMRIVLLRVTQAKELTRADRVRIGKELVARFSMLKEQFSFNAARAEAAPKLTDIAASAASPSQIVGVPEPSIEEWLAEV